MKVILSRKGFDAFSGGYPSPILPNGRLVSLPIPYGDQISYSNLRLDDSTTYYDLMKELRPVIKSGGEWKPLTPDTRCHLDPDVYRDILPREKGWKPLFGQSGAAQKHLNNYGVEKGDVFLFFGWFRRIIRKDGHYTFESQDLHVFFAYFQIGDMVNVDLTTEFPGWMASHPHISGRMQRPEPNTLYISNDFLSWDKRLPGAGTFNFNQNIVLTKKGYSRSRWDLPEFFRNVEISYHSENNWKADYFQSAARGQEFVVQDNDEVTAWVKDLIHENTSIMR